MPPMPEGVKDGILKGIYKFRPASGSGSLKAQLFGSGSIMLQVLRAQEILAERYDIAADVWGVTSYSELRREALRCERHNRLHPLEDVQVPYITTVLKGAEGPFVAASDYMKTVQDQVARWIPGRYVVLGTDGFGMSDTRPALRRHFEVDAESIVIATLSALREEGKVTAQALADAITALGVDPDKVDSASI